MNNEDIAKLLRTSASDQSNAGLADWAGNLWTFYSELRTRGFKAAEALTLVVGFQSALLSMMKRPPE